MKKYWPYVLRNSETQVRITPLTANTLKLEISNSSSNHPPDCRVSRASSRYRRNGKFLVSKPSENIPKVFWALLDHFGWSRIQPRGQNPTESIFRKLYCFWSETYPKAVRTILFLNEILLKPVPKKMLHLCEFSRKGYSIFSTSVFSNVLLMIVSMF